MKSELVSVIITNYNYQKYIGDAISSALALDWPCVEVIVIDDGSTDGSRSVIESFLPKGVTARFTENRGQAAAAQEGYLISRGDWIIFLDSDDMLDPAVIKESSSVMTPGWSKIQFQMQTIDADGRSLNKLFPKFKPNISPQMIRTWMCHTDSYPTPPTSGNLLSRSFLENIFPLELDMDRAVDSFFISTAPFLGDVITVNKPLVSYRVHGSNHGAQTVLDITRIGRDLRNHLSRCAYATRIAGRYGVKLSSERWRYGFYNLAMRVASIRLAPDKHPLAGDSIMKCLKDEVISCFIPQGYSMANHLAMFIWLLTITLAPHGIARKLVSWRFAPDSRPALIRKLIRVV